MENKKVDSIVGLSFEELSNSEMNFVTGAGDLNTETLPSAAVSPYTPLIVKGVASASASLVGGLISYTVKCIHR